MYGDVIDIVARDENVDGIIVIVLIHPPAMNDKVVDEVEKAYKSTNKPILVASTGGEPTQRILKMFQERGIPSYPEVERAVKAMKCLVDRGRYLKKLGKGIH
jgi:acyl-CoA synthetase (NDP forming)